MNTSELRQELEDLIVPPDHNHVRGKNQIIFPDGRRVNPHSVKFLIGRYLDCIDKEIDSFYNRVDIEKTKENWDRKEEDIEVEEYIEQMKRLAFG